ncbi:MAG TPA: hypothetical protein VG367_17810 [Mucilaginibacter sp.]|nr:hypothetical protein [Mucilaginibacter sp.]
MELSNGKKILLLSSGQPSLNPRLVKEADALAGAGYDVTVIYAYWNDWGTRYDQQLLSQKPWKAIRVAGGPDRQRLTFAMSRLLFKLSRRIFVARSTWFLIRESKKHPADLYIAHNLGALPAAVKAAKKYDKSCGFDAEDFHRNEVSDDPTAPDVTLKTRIENKYIPYAHYITASSPLIAAAYEKLFPAKRPVVILNAFPVDKRVSEPVIIHEEPLKLFWFSQTIGPHRGLETIVSALRNLREYPFELHLLGDLQGDFFSVEPTLNVYLHKPVAPDEIPLLASKFDIGLAAENSTPYNRDICLTNKIFTYMQAGLAIVASDTSAQIKLMSEYPGAGAVYRQNDIGGLADILLDYHKDREKLLEARKVSFNLARKTLNWETEKTKFLDVIGNALRSN